MTTISYLRSPLGFPTISPFSALQAAFGSAVGNLTCQIWKTPEAIWQELRLSALLSVSRRPAEALLAMWETQPALPDVDNVDNNLHTFHMTLWRWLALALLLRYTVCNEDERTLLNCVHWHSPLRIAILANINQPCQGCRYSGMEYAQRGRVTHRHPRGGSKWIHRIHRRNNADRSAAPGTHLPIQTLALRLTIFICSNNPSHSILPATCRRVSCRCCLCAIR